MATTPGHRGTPVDCRQCALYRVCMIAGLAGGTPAVTRHRRPFPAGVALTPGPAPSVVALRSGALKRVPLAGPGEGVVTGFALPGEVVTTAGRADEGWVARSTAHCCTLSREAIAALCQRDTPALDACDGDGIAPRSQGRLPVSGYRRRRTTATEPPMPPSSVAN